MTEVDWEQLNRQIVEIWSHPYFLERVDRDIQKYRTDQQTFLIVDQGGLPVPGAGVSVEMTDHEFGFGTQDLRFGSFETDEINQRYEDWIRAVFNQTTIGTSWKWIEWEKEKFYYKHVDRHLEKAKRHSLKTLGHCLYWDHHEWFKPSWIQATEIHQDDYMSLWKRWIDQVAIRYNGKIDRWHVINEATWKEDGHVDERVIVKDGFYKAFEYVNRMIEGKLGMCFYQDVYYGAWKWGTKAQEYQIAQNIIARGLPVDFISFQMHVWDERWRRIMYCPENLRRVFELFGQLGVAIEISELAMYWGIHLDLPELRDGKHNPESMSAIVSNIYRFLFSCPEIRAITYWFEWGRTAAWGGGNMWTDDKFNPYPVFHSVTNLITQEWKTNFDARSDADGIVLGRCFFGAYRITVEHKGEKSVHYCRCFSTDSRVHQITLSTRSKNENACADCPFMGGLCLSDHRRGADCLWRV